MCAYIQAYPSTRPLWSSAVDPRVCGNRTQLRWLYNNLVSNVVGVAIAEINGASSEGSIAKLLAILNTGDNLKVTSANGGVETFTVNHSSGAPKAKTDALGRTTAFNYDAGGLVFLASFTDPLGAKTSFALSVFGNKLTETYADGSFRKWTREGLERCFRKGFGRLGWYSAGLVSPPPIFPKIAKDLKVMVWQR